MNLLKLTKRVAKYSFLWYNDVYIIIVIAFTRGESILWKREKDVGATGTTVIEFVH